ncbi:MAG: hypothetical protein PVSMB4_02360 [Ktedonobacterales bacterium]
MPRSRKPSNLQVTRLTRLPRRADLVILGGRRTLEVSLRDGAETIQPQVALWLDAQSGYVRASTVINPLRSQDGGLSESLDALVQACTGPFDGPPGGVDHLPSPAPTGRSASRARPPKVPQPGLPVRIVVNEAALAEAARSLLQPLDIAIEHTEQLPSFDEAFESLSGFLRTSIGPDGEPEPFAWEIDTSLLPALYKAAAGYWRRAPWTYMPDEPPLAIALGEHGPQPGVETLYASILGAADMVIGVAFYYSLDDFRQALHAGAEMAVEDVDVDAAITMLRQAGMPVDQIPAEALRDLVTQAMAEQGLGVTVPQQEVMQHSLVVFYDDVDEIDPTYLEWMARHGLKYPSRQGVPSCFRTAPQDEPRRPNEREITALTLALEATNQFFSHHGRALQGPFLPTESLSYRARVGSGSSAVVVETTFPPPGYEIEVETTEDLDEPEAPASATGPTTLYRFRVTLESQKAVWRRIELRGDQTLHDLHEAIQDAFDWDDDHLYAFFLSGKAWDEDNAYESPHSDGRNAARYRLEHLPLQPGKQVLYIFDFGDELRHLVKLEAVTPGGVLAKVEYPRITERHGASVPQYPGDEADPNE